MWKLPDVRTLLATVSMAYQCMFFLEVFSGDCGITMGVMLSQVPCVLPWDSRYGPSFDVLKAGHVITELVSAGLALAIHFGTPCQSQTFARLPQLRSWKFPGGLDSLLPHQRTLVDIGNALLKFAVDLFFLLLTVGGYFSIVNPELCWLLVQTCMLLLM